MVTSAPVSGSLCLPSGGVCLLHGGAAWQACFDDFAENSMGGSTSNRMGKIGMSMLKKAASGGDRFIDILAAHHGANWLISGTKPFGNGDNIRADLIIVTGK